MYKCSDFWFLEFFCWKKSWFQSFKYLAIFGDFFLKEKCIWFRIFRNVWSMMHMFFNIIFKTVYICFNSITFASGFGTIMDASCNVVPLLLYMFFNCIPFPFTFNWIWLATVFLLNLNQKENCHHDHIPFDLKGYGI